MKYFALLCALVPLFVCSNELSLQPPPFKGPLLSPSPYFPGKGHQQYEIYSSWTSRNSRFDQDWHSKSIRHFDTFLGFTIFKFGLSSRLEIDITPEWLYNYSQGPHNWRLGDCHFAFAIKLMEENPLANLGWPNIKLRLGTTIPFGKYDRLDPKKHLTDAGGLGTSDPSLALLLGKYLHITKNHWICMRAGYTFFFGTPVGIDGLSVYGDAERIGHTVHLGNRWEVNWGFEATLLGKFSLIGDLVASYKNSDHYSKLKHPSHSSLVFKVAPGLEYDFSEFIGILAGPAINFAGRNRDCDVTWMLAVKIHN